MRVVLLFALSLAVLPGPAAADVLVRGTHGVVHELVLESTPLLDGRALVATPTRGFGGLDIVVPGVPFRFSSKYGTMLYLVTESDVERLDEPAPGETLPHPRAAPPIREIRSARNSSPIVAATTTIALRGVGGDRLRFDVVGHVERDRNGRPVRGVLLTPVWIAVLVAGLALGGGLWFLRARES